MMIINLVVKGIKEYLKKKKKEYNKIFDGWINSLVNEI